MESVSNKIPSGITVDIESAPKMSSSSSSDGFFSTDGKTSYTRIGLIVVILLFLGVNIFTYLVFQKLLEMTNLRKFFIGKMTLHIQIHSIQIEPN